MNTPYANNRTSENSIAWPKIKAVTATYIGLRTCRYQPDTTRCFVGNTGAGVPTPSIAKRRNESISTIDPAAISATPAMRSNSASGNPSCAVHREINHGTKPATVPGASKKKMIEPKAAETRFIEIDGGGVAFPVRRSYLQIFTVCNGRNGSSRVTKPFTMQSQDDRVPPQWLVSAFLVLLSAAILAAAPAISAANRGTTEASSTLRGLGERIVVRAQIQVRFLQSKPAGSPDFALVSADPAPIAFADDRIAPQAQDAGTRIVQRGIKIRAPPAHIA